MPIVVSSPGPDLGPVTLADAKSHLNIPATDTSQDVELVGFLNAAVEIVSEYVGSPIAPTLRTETHRAAATIVLRQSRVVGAVTVTDAAGVAVTGYTVEPGGLLVRYGYGTGFGALTVTYTAGFSPLPAAVRLAILYTVQHAYEAQQGAVPVSFQSGADETFVVSRGFALPNRAKEYLAPYRRGQRFA